MIEDDDLHIDFETRSVVDLRKFGLGVYARHPSTEAWCMGYAFGANPVEAWRMGEDLPDTVRNHVKRGGVVKGHNVLFEWYIWNFIMVPRYGWPVLKLSQLDCTMARAFAMALPGGLEKLAIALNVGQRKDMGGHALMMKMCKPRNIIECPCGVKSECKNCEGTGVEKITWWDAEELQLRQIAYCKMDVVVERECDAELYPLSESQRRLWQLDLRINLRGIAVDIPAINATKVQVARCMKRMDKEMKLASAGGMSKVSEAKRTLEWCQARGIEIDNLKKHTIKDFLEDPDLPYEVREVLEIRSKSAKISVSKLDTMLNWSLADGRLYGQFQYHGATTGRFSGRGVQLHNLPRPEPQWEDAALQNLIITDLARGVIDDTFVEDWYGPFMRVISSCIRGYLIAGPGKELIGADLKNIEGVTLAWLAGEEWKLDAFRENFFEDGPGIYELTAGKILGKSFEDVDKQERQVWGKVSELSLGYQGGKGAYISMGVNYGVKIAPEKAEEIKVGWRNEHPATKQYWWDNEKAAINALRHPGVTYHVGPEGRQVSYRWVGECLLLRLPSGRPLVYPFPELRPVKTPWGDMKELPTFMSTDSKVGSPTKGKYVRQSTYGGKLVENITQGTALDILAEGMLRVEAAKYPIVLHVHDESVSEVPKGFGAVKEYEDLMSIVPAWAQDLPLAADGFRGMRYRK